MIGMTANTRYLLSAASLSVIAMMGAAVPTSATAQEVRGGTITVPAMPLAKAIDEIGAQAGVTVDYDPDAVKTLRSKPVSGATSVRRALEQAIAGSPIAIVLGDNGKLTIVNDIVVTAQRDEAETSILVRQATTSDRNGLGLRDQPRNTQVISAKTIADQQALNITDILRNAGGVSATSNDGNSGASYTVRGFSAAGLINGLSGGGQNNSIAGSANQPIANIERVEILKGPDALMAGFGNLGGNVNVVTKKPSAEQRLAMTFDIGSFGLVRGVLDANNAITADKKLSGRVVASVQKMDHNYGGYDNNDDYLFAPSLRFKDQSTDIIIGASLSKAVTGIGAFTLFDNVSGNIIDRDPSVPIYTPNQGIRAEVNRFYFDATRQIVPGLEFVARGLHEKTTSEVRVLQFGYFGSDLFGFIGGSKLDSKSDALDSFFRVKTHFGDFFKASFNVGYNYSRGTTDQRNSSDFIVVPNPPLGANTGDVVPFSPFGDLFVSSQGKQQGVYGQALFEFWKIKLLGGVRKTWFETKAEFFFPGAPILAPDKRKGTSPSAGIIFDVTPSVSIFANYARGVEASFGVSRTGEIFPNITTINKEAGVKIDLFNKRATINASYFDIQQDNIQVTDPIDQNFQVPGPGQRGRGIDLNITGQLLPGWTVLGSLTRTKFVLLSPNEFETTVRRQPRDTYSVYSIYRTKITDGLSGGMSAGLYGRSSSFADPLGIYVVPAARQVDVNGFLTWKGFDINLGLRNIFDRRNYNTTSSNTFVPVDEPRNVRLTISKRLF